MTIADAMTKWKLLDMLTTTNPAAFQQGFTDSSGKRYLGILESIEREDGSGRSFNLRINGNGIRKTIHVRTID